MFDTLRSPKSQYMYEKLIVRLLKDPSSTIKSWLPDAAEMGSYIIKTVSL